VLYRPMPPPYGVGYNKDTEPLKSPRA